MAKMSVPSRKIPIKRSSTGGNSQGPSSGGTNQSLGGISTGSVGFKTKSRKFFVDSADVWMLMRALYSYKERHENILLALLRGEHVSSLQLLEDARQEINSLYHTLFPLSQPIDFSHRMIIIFLQNDTAAQAVAHSSIESVVRGKTFDVFIHQDIKLLPVYKTLFSQCAKRQKPEFQ